MTRRLRYSSTATMPDGMRQRAEHALQRHVATPAPREKGDKRRSKYGNCPTTVDGLRFDSKKEARYYERLVLERAAGTVSYFLRQVSIHLPGGTRYVIDFLVVMADGRIRYVDVKGKETPVFRLKKREVEHQYPIEIELV